jgi:hypothetical protein
MDFFSSGERTRNSSSGNLYESCNDALKTVWKVWPQLVIAQVEQRGERVVLFGSAA